MFKKSANCKNISKNLDKDTNIQNLQSPYKNAYVVTSVAGGGKSTFLSLAKENFSVLSADELGHRLLLKHSKKLSFIFGDEILIDGVVDRKKLGDIVFFDDKKRLILNEFMHKRIKRAIYHFAFCMEKIKRPYFIEIPLFFESEQRYDFDKIILVYAPKKECLKRLKARSGYSNKKALRILNSQIDINTKLKNSTFVLKNTKTKNDFIKLCKRFLRSIDDI